MNTNEEKKTDVIQDQEMDQVNAGANISTIAAEPADVAGAAGKKHLVRCDILDTFSAGTKEIDASAPKGCVSSSKARVMCVVDQLENISASGDVVEAEGYLNKTAFRKLNAEAETMIIGGKGVATMAPEKKISVPMTARLSDTALRAIDAGLAAGNFSVDQQNKQKDILDQRAFFK